MKNALRETPTVATLSHPPPDSPRASGDEIDLLAYVSTCWRYRYVLLAVGLVVAGITYTINRRMTPMYETRFRLMATETGLQDAPGNRWNIVAFRELVESPTQVAGLLTEFDLFGAPHHLRPEKFLRSNVDVEVIRDSTIIEVTLRLRDSEVLVQLARRYAERVVETAQRLNTEGIDYTAERIKEQRDAALDRLRQTDEALQEYQRRAQIELLRVDVDTLLFKRSDALDLTVQIQGARARLQQAEAELARQPRVREERRGVDSVPAAAAGGEQRGATPEDLRIRGELLDPYVNPVYEAIARDVSEYRARLAGLEEERKELVSRLQLDAASSEKLGRLYQAETGLAALMRSRDVAEEAYLNAANKYEEASLQSTIRSPRLQILDPALPPEAPVAPRTVRNTLAATLIALTLAAALVLVFDATRRRTPTAA